LRQAQRVTDLGAKRQADQAAGVLGHEVDRFGADFFGGYAEVAFILAVLVVDDHEHPPGPEILDGLRDGGERHGLSIRITRRGKTKGSVSGPLEEPHTSESN
jgi:hypothetical protein